MIWPLLLPLPLSRDFLKDQGIGLSCNLILFVTSNHFLNPWTTLNNQGGLIWVDFANGKWFFFCFRTWINLVWCCQAHLQDCGQVAIQQGDRESSKPERGDKHLKEIFSPSSFPKLLCSRGICFLRTDIWKLILQTALKLIFKGKQALALRFLGTRN